MSRASSGAEDAVGVLRDQAGQQVGDPLAGPAVELAEHAVVERGDHPAGQDAEVARVRVGMEEAELEDLLEQDPRPGHGHLGGIDAQCAGCPSRSSTRDAADELHGDHAGGRELVDRERDVRGRVAGELAPGSAASSAARS